MYGISTYIYHEHPPNVGKYTIHGWYGIVGVYIPIIRIPIKGGDDPSQHREVIDPGTFLTPMSYPEPFGLTFQIITTMNFEGCIEHVVHNLSFLNIGEKKTATMVGWILHHTACLSKFSGQRVRVFLSPQATKYTFCTADPWRSSKFFTGHWWCQTWKMTLSPGCVAVAHLASFTIFANT